MKHLLTLFTLILLITSCGKDTEVIIENPNTNCKELKSVWKQRQNGLALDLTNLKFDTEQQLTILASLNDEKVVCTYNIFVTGNESQGGLTVSYRPVSRGWGGNLSEEEVAFCKSAEDELSYEMRCTNLVTCDEENTSDCKTYE